MEQTFSYTPVIVTFAMLTMIALDVVADAKRGIWHTFEIGVIVVSVLALLWWITIKTKGFA